MPETTNPTTHRFDQRMLLLCLLAGTAAQSEAELKEHLHRQNPAAEAADLSEDLTFLQAAGMVEPAWRLTPAGSGFYERQKEQVGDHADFPRLLQADQQRQESLSRAAGKGQLSLDFFGTPSRAPARV